MTIEHVYVSEKGKKQLSRLKSKTGIQQWNYLCRWAFCLSLQEKSVPPLEDIKTDSSIDMSWQTFAGEYHEVYMALLKTRMKNDGLAGDDENLKLYFRIHLHRGISYLTKKVNSISDLYQLQIAS
ncbi:MAG: DNA sulfur modification protein DndE [Oleiphilaceae bacterium]|jgi:DNA sulfur modification protein DndE